MASPLELDFTNRCPICLIDEIENPAKTSCDHEFCEPCITEWKKKVIRVQFVELLFPMKYQFIMYQILSNY